MTNSTMKQIVQAEPRTDIRLNIQPDDVTLSAPLGTTLEDILTTGEDLNLLHFDAPLIAAIVDNKLRELRYAPERDATVTPVLLSDSDGGRIYRRSLVLLMATALDELFPGTKANVNYAVSDGGFFCDLANREPLSEDQVAQLEAHMKGIVAADDPILKRVVPLPEAQSIFRERGDDDKVRLLQYRTRDDLTIYQLHQQQDYYYGYMVPSTGYLSLFRLIHVEGGFILQYPRKSTVSKLGDITTYTKLSAVFRQADEWLERIRLEDIGRLNGLVSRDHVQELILVTEALHEQNIASIGRQISERHKDGVQIVLIAGPSSSGKTTFAKRLAIQLIAFGLRPFTLEMDNYFVDRESTPLDETGEYDFESLYALDIPRFNDDLNALLSGAEVQLPRFDFVAGRSISGRVVQLASDQIIIIEGIHGLNPELVQSISNDKLFRVYVSALTGLNIDSHNRVPTTDVRLLRRIVRDARTRGWSATDTLARWRSVRRGEKRNIFPFQENADVMFNSSMVYELAALRPLVEPLLLQVEPSSEPHIEAHRLRSFLRWVQPFDMHQTGLIPDTSILREFIGGSILHEYHPGEAAE